MMYQIGEKVVYPMHGVGVVQNIEEKDILGKKRKYYIMELSHTNMTVMVPVDMSTKIGLRGVVSIDEISKAFGVLSSIPTELEDDWKIRYSNNHTKVKNGSFLELAEVVRNLFKRNQVKELSNSEKKLFENALNLMIDEIALTKEIEKIEVEHMITETLEKNLFKDKKEKEELETKSIR